MMYRRVGGRNERYAENAAELVRFKVDVMLRQQLAAKRATSVILVVAAVSLVMKRPAWALARKLLD